MSKTKFVIFCKVSTKCNKILFTFKDLVINGI